MLSETKGGLGMLGGQKCWHAPVGRTQSGEAVALPISCSSAGGLALPCLWDRVSLRHSLLAGSRPSKHVLADPNHFSLAPLWCQCPMKAKWELSVGRVVAKTSSPELCQS